MATTGDGATAGDRRTVRVTSWDEIGPALDAGKRPWIEFTCGMCKQRVAEEFHSVAVTTYHQVAEEECARLRVELDAARRRDEAREERIAALEATLREILGQGLPCHGNWWVRCVYCGHVSQDASHAEGCAWVRAKQLLDAPGAG